MKITIDWTPKFSCEFTLEQLDRLIEISKRHYDGVCRSASGENGFLIQWRQRIEAEIFNSIYATFRELDIVLKICEMAHFYQFDKKIISAMCSDIHAALSKANNEVLTK